MMECVLLGLVLLSVFDNGESTILNRTHAERKPENAKMGVEDGQVEKPQAKSLKLVGGWATHLKNMNVNWDD